MTEAISYTALKETIAQHGLKVTSQRIAIYEALLKLDHPNAEEIAGFIGDRYPSISLGTIYKTLDTFVEKGLIKKVKTPDEHRRYDAQPDDHHHIYCKKTNTIKDYYDKELKTLLEDYFSRKEIPNFRIHDIQVQINGELEHRDRK